jgi:RHS repeat-associated protein
VSYTYDGADRLLTMTYPSGRIITYVRNANGKITGVTSKANATATALTLASNVLWQPNVAGAVSGETVFGQGNIATAVQNQALPNDGGLGTVDLLQSLTYGNGLVLWKNFNTDNELYQLIVEQSPSTLAGIRINRFYNRANETNITGIADGLTPANDETYSYTDAGRLAGATSSTTASFGARSWTYDNNGNRLTETANGTVNIYAYPANNNRLSTVKQGTTTTRAFVYDAAGNATRDTRGTTAYNYAVNNAGRIKTLTIGTTLRTTYTYDGMQKLRVKAQTTPVSTTHYIWDAFGHIIAEHASAGGVQKEYIWLGDTPLAVFEGANLFYVHPDNLDRPVMMTNNNIGQTIAWQAKYDPFGNAVTVTSAITNNQRLPGQWFQIEDGLAYNWHRTYDPTIGRYTQADPLGFVDGPSVYGYAGQSPVMRVDPRGQWIQFISGGIFAGGFIAYEYYTNPCATFWDLAGAGINGFLTGIGGPASMGGRGLIGLGGISGARRLGLQTEKRILEKLGLPKNTKSILGNEGKSIPDGLTPSRLVEIKDAARVSFDKQLRNHVSGANGRKLELYVRDGAKISNNVSKHFEVTNFSQLGPL